MKLLIDADSLLYKAGFSAQKTMYRIKGQEVEYTKEALADAAVLYKEEDVESFIFAEQDWVAISRMKEQCNQIEERFPDMDVTYYLTKGRNFRYKIYPEYKGNRVSPKPVHYELLFNWLVNKRKTVISTDIEADDAVRIDYEAGDVLCHIDKDLNQIVGTHFNYSKNEVYEVDVVQGLRSFYKQLLTGDSIDNIPGLKGIGPKKAEKAIDHLETAAEMYETCWNFYKERGLTIEEMNRNATLLHLLRWEDDVWQAPTNLQ